ncbi:hypothetical protein NE237_003919 [Protea cynaroides]|uniref:RING-type E3 ubiquitin transferase n=1 Tax=Protea cynaroides TaxID=273540 RepID=A0A9Q0KHZ5_9MAGN|nr:hypothetical protein NE237_003919 [Protea cynaroides]
MESAAKQQEQQSQLQFTPLMISVIGIMSTALALVLYHYILTRYCLRHRRGAISRLQQQPQEEAMAGVDDKVLHTIPVLAYSSNHQGGNGWLFRSDQSECVVCLGELQEGDMVRLLPNCRHAFHLLCIDHWFLAHSTCPLCRSLAVGGDHVLYFADPSSSLSSSVPPIAGIEDGHGAFHRGTDANDLIVPDATTKPRSNGLLPQCLCHSERSKPPLLPIPLKRSLPLDL